MKKHFDYTTQARAFALRYPLLSHIGIQINFWVIAFVLLVTIMHLSSRMTVQIFGIEFPILYAPAFGTGVIAGMMYGVVLGFVDWRLDKRISRKMSLGWLIAIRSSIYFLVLLGIVAFIRYFLWERVITVYFYDPSIITFTDTTWRYIFFIFGIYCLVMAPAISFINQINKKFGPGILIPMLLGRYRDPVEQERLFMLLDMKSSTTIAEKLGHRRYSSLVRDSFLDINQVLFEHQAEIYQYVGDEIVVSWLVTRNFDDTICLDFFFGCQQQFRKRIEYYKDNYGMVPEFKAGAHRGLVMAVEVGDIKREIAYHGDTLNTAARIQSVCNQYGKMLLVSAEIAEAVAPDTDYVIEPVGEIELKGKGEPTRLFAVES